MVLFQVVKGDSFLMLGFEILLLLNGFFVLFILYRVITYED